jgi:hypothetical protein
MILFKGKIDILSFIEVLGFPINRMSNPRTNYTKKRRIYNNLNFVIIKK